MNNFREVNDDLLKDWLEFRDQTVLAYTTKEDKKHTIEFDEICEKISVLNETGGYEMENLTHPPSTEWNLETNFP